MPNDQSSPLISDDQSTYTSGSVNWLGSSYSGVDIKAVIHLYGSHEGSNEKLKHEANVALYVSMGLSEFVSLMEANRLNKESINEVLLQSHEPEATSLLEDAVRHITNKSYISNLKSYKKKWLDVLERLKHRMKSNAQGSNTLELGTLQTISLQTNREQAPVRAIGQSHIKGTVSGPRTIAGSMIFTVFNEDALAKLMRAMGTSRSVWNNKHIPSLIPDQLPPLDMTISFANEYGSRSEQRIFGIKFVNNGTTYSIEDLFTEQIMQFTARDCDVLTDRGHVLLSRTVRHNGNIVSVITGDDVLAQGKTSYDRYLERIGERRRIMNR